MSVENTALSFFAEELGQDSNTGLVLDFREPYSRAMDMALDIERSSLSAAARLNLDAVELAGALAPLACDLCGLAATMIASSMQWTLYMLAMPAAYFQAGLPRPSGATAIGAELARSMDIATGNEASVAHAAGEVAHKEVSISAMPDRANPAPVASAEAESDDASDLELASVA